MNVIKLETFKHKLNKTKLSEPLNEQYNLALDKSIDEWEKYSNVLQKNMNFLLCDLFDVEYKDYVHNLNLIQDLENKIKIKYFVYGPETLYKKQKGYIAGFYLNDEAFSTPEMLLESYARAFNLLLFFKLNEIINNK